MKLNDSLARDCQAAVEIIIARAPDHAHEAARFQDAVKKHSPVLFDRFRMLLGNVMGGPDRHAFTEDEKHDLGQTLVHLGEVARTGKPGPKVRGNEYRLMIYLTDAEHTALVEYCAEERMTHAAAARLGLRLLFEKAEERRPTASAHLQDRDGVPGPVTDLG